MLLFDATHTSHTRAQTGIQRVTRSLFSELKKTHPAAGVCYDPYQQTWRPLTGIEKKFLHLDQPAVQSRGSHWSLRQRLTGRVRRWMGATPTLPSATGLICPELFSSKVGGNLPALFSSVSGPRIALFYDAIPLQYPEITPPAIVARFPAYLQELLRFDGIAAISETSAQILRDYWQWIGAENPPPVAAIPLAIQPSTRPSLPTAAKNSTRSVLPRLLCVSTIEGRKNHLALLEACALLWQEGLAFELQLIGLARPETGRAALEKITALQRAGHPLHYTGSVSDEALHTAYQQCAFTIYPSLIEGFGLPVLESLSHGKPCICSSQGALGESARDGGCLTLDRVEASSLAGAIRHLLQQPPALAALTAAARARPFKSWANYAAELTTWMQTIRRRS